MQYAVYSVLQCVTALNSFVTAKCWTLYPCNVAGPMPETLHKCNFMSLSYNAYSNNPLDVLLRIVTVGHLLSVLTVATT